MCKGPNIKDPKPALIPAPATTARQDGDIEARLRRARSGAAANILTSALGIPSGGKLGEVAR